MTTQPSAPLSLKSLSLTQIWTAGIAIVTLVAGTWTWAYNIGEKTATFVAQEKAAAISEELRAMKLQNALLINKNSELEKILTGSVARAENHKIELSNANTQIASLNEQRQGLRKCDFFRQQVLKTEQQIADVKGAKRSGLTVFIPGEDRDGREAQERERLKSTLEPLEQRLLAYSKQLGDC